MWRLVVITIIAILGQSIMSQSMAQGIISAWPNDYRGTREELSQRDLKDTEEYRKACRFEEARFQSSPAVDVHSGFIKYFQNLKYLTTSLIASNLFAKHKRANIHTIAEDYCRYMLQSVDKVTCLSESEAREILIDIAYRFAYLGKMTLSDELYRRAEAISLHSPKPWIGKSPDPKFRPQYFLTHVNSPLTP